MDDERLKGNGGGKYRKYHAQCYCTGKYQYESCDLFKRISELCCRKDISNANGMLKEDGYLVSYRIQRLKQDILGRCHKHQFKEVEVIGKDLLYRLLCLFFLN